MVEIPQGIGPGELFIVGRSEDRTTNGALLHPGDLYVVYANKKMGRLEALDVPWEVAEALATDKLHFALKRLVP